MSYPNLFFSLNISVIWVDIRLHTLLLPVCFRSAVVGLLIWITLYFDQNVPDSDEVVVLPYFILNISSDIFPIWKWETNMMQTSLDSFRCRKYLWPRSFRVGPETLLLQLTFQQLSWANNILALKCLKWICTTKMILA